MFSSQLNENESCMDLVRGFNGFHSVYSVESCDRFGRDSFCSFNRDAEIDLWLNKLSLQWRLMFRNDLHCSCVVSVKTLLLLLDSRARNFENTKNCELFDV